MENSGLPGLFKPDRKPGVMRAERSCVSQCIAGDLVDTFHAEL